MSQPGDVLKRFHEVLLRQITDTRPDYLTAPFTVAEIYQDLVPYRSHRDLIGIEMNGDYEDALIRMLSGEGDYLIMDSDVARREIQRELAGSNPNTALFRDFAAVDVRLHPSRVPIGAEAAVPAGVPDPPRIELEEPSAELGLGLEASEKGLPWLSEFVDDGPAERDPEPQPQSQSEPQPPRSAQPVMSHPAEPVERRRPGLDGSGEDGVVGHIETVAATLVPSQGEPIPEQSVSSDAELQNALTVCTWCREDLPVRVSIHFCPFCGSDLRPSPCLKCGEAMEARWQFCISCGTDVRG
jgi:hypothetical protein